MIEPLTDYKFLRKVAKEQKIQLRLEKINRKRLFKEFLNTMITGELKETVGCSGIKINTIDKLYFEKDAKRQGNEIAEYVNSKPDVHPMRVENINLADKVKEAFYSLGIYLLDKRTGYSKKLASSGSL